MEAVEKSSMWEHAVAALGTLVVGGQLGTWSARRKARIEDKERERKELTEDRNFVITSLKTDVTELKGEVRELRAEVKNGHNSIIKLNSDLAIIQDENRLLIRERDELLAAKVELQQRLSRVKGAATAQAVELQRQIQFISAELSRVVTLYEQATGEPIPAPEPMTPEEERMRAILAEEKIAKKMEEEWLNNEGVT